MDVGRVSLERLLSLSMCSMFTAYFKFRILEIKPKNEEKKKEFSFLVSYSHYEIFSLLCLCMFPTCLHSYGIFSFSLIFLVEGRGVLQATLTLNGLAGGILLGLFSLGIFFKSANVKVSDNVSINQRIMGINLFRVHSMVVFYQLFASLFLELYLKQKLKLKSHSWPRL